MTMWTPTQKRVICFINQSLSFVHLYSAWPLYSAVSLKYHTAGTVSWYAARSHYPGNVSTIFCAEIPLFVEHLSRELELPILNLWFESIPGLPGHRECSTTRQPILFFVFCCCNNHSATVYFSESQNIGVGLGKLKKNIFFEHKTTNPVHNRLKNKFAIKREERCINVTKRSPCRGHWGMKYACGLVFFPSF